MLKLIWQAWFATDICLFSIILPTTFKLASSQCVYTPPPGGKLIIQETDFALVKPQLIEFPITGNINDGTINLAAQDIEHQYLLDRYKISFATNPINGLNYIEIGASIDRDGESANGGDDLDLISFVLKCSYTDPVTGGKNNVFYDINLEVLDSNDNVPTFQNAPYKTSRSEALPVGTTIYNGISATDKDVNLNKKLVYSIEAGGTYKGNQAFTIPNPGTGVIVLNQKLDYEYLKQKNTETLTMVIKVRDSAEQESLQKSTTTQLSVTITDDDDLPPTFTFPDCKNDVPDLSLNCNDVVYVSNITTGRTNELPIKLIPEVDGVTQQNPVVIEACDLDYLNDPITFAISSSYPFGFKSRFSLTSLPSLTRNGRIFRRTELRQEEPVKRSETDIVILMIQALQTTLSDTPRLREALIKLYVEDQNPTDTTESTEAKADDTVIIVLAVCLSLLACGFITFAFIMIWKLRSKLSKSTNMYEEPLKQIQCVDSNPLYDELDTFCLSYDSIKLLSTKLGSGQFGEVWKGRLNTDGLDINVAVKIVKDLNNIYSVSDLKQELETLKKVGSHPNVVQLYGYSDHNDGLYIVMEYMPSGDLRSYLQKSRKALKNRNTGSTLNKILTQRDILQLALDIAAGMAHLASRQIIHRDLAARNILLDARYRAKVSDFGLARIDEIYFKTSKSKIPVRWMAIESLLENKYTTKSDVWSFGVVIWEMATLGGTPYVGMQGADIKEKLKAGFRLPKPNNCSEELYELMMECWASEEDSRPSFDDLHTKLQLMRDDTVTYINMNIDDSDRRLYDDVAVTIE